MGQLNIRTTPDDDALLLILSDRLGTTKTEVIRQSLRLLDEATDELFDEPEGLEEGPLDEEALEDLDNGDPPTDETH